MGSGVIQMKWKGIILLAAVAFAGYFWWPDSAPPQNEVTQTMPAASSSEYPPPAEPGSTLAPAPAQSAVSTADPDQQAAADELEREIKTLMADFDHNRHDSQRREQIQSQIDVLMAEYNEIILPIALSKIKEGN